jgi:diguanylate cyclase (GGDEF)-like protein
MTIERIDYEDVPDGATLAEHGHPGASNPEANNDNGSRLDRDGHSARVREGHPPRKNGAGARTPTGALLGTCFRPTSTLRSGRQVQTWRAIDVRDGSEVVIKTAPLPAISSAAWMRLEHDVEALARIQKPSFAAPVAVSQQDGVGYLVTPFVPGVSLDSVLRDGPLAVDETLAVALGVLQALQEAHACGVLHRNVKPENVISTGHGPLLEAAVLIDFGFGRGSVMEPPRQDELLSAARYISPEQAGLVARPVDERSDLYSVGVVLFECLAGTPPFQARVVGELLRCHLTIAPPALRDLGLNVPRALDEFVQRLLAKDPRDRYQSAQAALADVAEIAAARKRGIDDPAFVIGLHDSRSTLVEPALVGRSDEFGALDFGFQSAARGEGGLFFVEAESGGGKTRLLDELAHRAARVGAWTLRAQGIEQVASSPLPVIMGIAQEIVSRARGDAELAARIRQAVGDLEGAVCAVLPELAEVLEPREVIDAGPEAFAEARIVDGLTRLLESLGSEEQPAVVILDDCQWSSSLTANLLEHWQLTAAEAPRQVLVVAAFRSEEVPADHPLRRVKPTAGLVLPPLSRGDIERLGETMAGELPPEARDAVVRLSRGNPFMACAVLRGLVECGALVDEPFGWRVDPEAMSSVQSSREAADFLARRFELLSGSARALIAAAAVLGKAFDLDFAAELARQRPREAVAAMEEARRRDIVWEHTQEPRHAFVHDKVRDAVLASLDDYQRGRLHLHAAFLMVKRTPDRVFELAYHFDAAGEHKRALPFAMAAAKQARARHSLDQAEEQYRIAQRGVAFEDDATRLELAEGLGDVLMLSGRYDVAQREFELARSLASGRLDQARIEGKFGELGLNRGDVISASAALERALERLGERVPRNRLAVLVMVLVEVVVQAAHTLMPRLFVGRRRLDDAGADLVAARLYSRLAHVYWFQRGRLPTFWSHLRGMNVAERYPPTPELAQAYSEHAPAMTMVPSFRRGIAYARKSLAIRRAQGDRWGEGQSLHFLGVVLYSASEYEESIACCKEAITLLESTGDRWELNTAKWHMAFAHYRRGELAEAAEIARALHREGVDSGEAQASGISLGAWAKATGGHVPLEAIEQELARPVGDVHTRAEVLQASAVGLIGAGRPDEAVEVLEQAWHMVKAKGLRQEYVSPILPWLATALRLEASRAPLSAPRGRAALLRRARRTARRGLRLARSYRNNLPHALREMALAEAAQGRQRRSRRLFEQSLEGAETQGARFEYLQTLLAKGRTGQALGFPDADRDVVEATRGLAALRAEPIQLPEAVGSVALGGADEEITLSLADRFETLLELGRRIATGLSTEAIYETVSETGVSLLRGEECVILAVPTDGQLTDLRVVAGATDAGIQDYSQAMALEAMGKSEILIYSFEDGPDDPLRMRLAYSGVRSALCAPIFLRGRPVGCFYVEHRRISGLFGDEERRLAGFVATLAGAALENADGLAAAQDLASSLSRRTSQLEDANRRLDYSVKELTSAYERERQIAGQLNHMAFHDSLTNLANRVLLTESVGHAVRRAQRSKTNLAVLFLDLDDFKTINDSLGHSIGDELLIAVAQRLRACVRESDTAARISGDEFAILLEDIGDPSGAAASAERVLEALQPPFTLAGTEIFVRASIGIAVGPSGQRSTQASELLRNADLAMYMAKSEKKGSYRFFAPGMHAGLLARLELKADLERAISHNDFTIHYQPIVSLADGTIDGLEALLRWRHPTRGLVGPSEFLALAEETGLVRPVGHWVLREACRQGVIWQRRVGDALPLTISVNLSPAELLEPELVDQVAAALEESRLLPGRLILELTESVFMQDTEATMERLIGLKKLGVKLAIDDFGTGYSSLGYLQRLPLDRIKVAKQFVDDVSKGASDSALTRAIIKLGETFELETVAEGIEHAAQLRRLREIGCKLGQGYYFAHAVAPEEIDALLIDPTPLRARWQPAVSGEPRH